MPITARRPRSPLDMSHESSVMSHVTLIQESRHTYALLISIYIKQHAFGGAHPSTPHHPSTPQQPQLAAHTYTSHVSLHVIITGRCRAHTH